VSVKPLVARTGNDTTLAGDARSTLGSLSLVQKSARDALEAPAFSVVLSVWVR
jgi:hypothetical protein